MSFIVNKFMPFQVITAFQISTIPSRIFFFFGLDLTLFQLTLHGGARFVFSVYTCQNVVTAVSLLFSLVTISFRTHQDIKINMRPTKFRRHLDCVGVLKAFSSRRLSVYQHFTGHVL